MVDAPEAFPPAGQPTPDQRRIGVLAIQGDFEAHAKMLRQLGAEVVEVRRPEQLDDLHGLVLPGGESTTIEMGIDAYGLREPLVEFARSGGPVFGTCAGLILLDRDHLGVFDASVERNAYGRQIKSFEAPVEVRGLGDEPIEAVFIRAPRIATWGDAVEVLAELDGTPVVAREDNVLVTSFHPELTDDLRLHTMFFGIVDAQRRATGDQQREASQ